MHKGNAIVTGAADRLGKAMALHLADLGFNVVVHYMTSSDAAKEVVSLIKEKGRLAVSLQADLLDSSVVEKLIPEAVKRIGGNLNVLINNASIFEYDNLDTASGESWKRHIGSNLQAPFFLTQEFARQAPNFDIDENILKELEL